MPPLPGDTITLFGVCMAVQLGFGAAWIMVAITAGAISGSLVAYALGRWMDAHPTSLPAWARNPRTQEALAKVRRGFERRGAALLLINRFVPAMRAFFFVGAGLARMPWYQVTLYGGLSVLAWNGVILLVGVYIGREFEALAGWVEHYSVAALIVLSIVVLGWFARRRWRG